MLKRGQREHPDPLPPPLLKEHVLSTPPPGEIKCQWNGWCVQLRWDLLPPLAAIDELSLQVLELSSICMLQFWRSLACLGIFGKHSPSLRWREPRLFYLCSHLSSGMLQRAVVVICTSERTCTFTPTFQFMECGLLTTSSPFLRPPLFGDKRWAWIRLDPLNYSIMFWIKTRGVGNMKSPGKGRGKIKPKPKHSHAKWVWGCVMRASSLLCVFMAAYVSVMWAAGV